MRKVVEWNQKWAFTKDADIIPATMPQRWYWVNLPHTWNAIDGQDGGSDYYQGKAFYAKELDLVSLGITEEDLKTKEVYLEIPAANSCATVYLNGACVGEHKGGYSTWRVKLVDLKSEHNLIVIECENENRDDVYPVTADFTFYGGLYRGIKLLVVDACHFDLDYYGASGVKVTPIMNGENAELTIESFVSGISENASVTYTIYDMAGNVIETIANKAAASNKTTYLLQKAHLWNGRKDPYLYCLKASLVCDEVVIDEVVTRFGCRSFEIDPENGFILNGKPYPLHGVARHQDFWGVGNAITKAEHERDMDLICEMGANTIRLAHYQHDQYFYDLCDEKGMIVWAEIPYISRHKSEGRENTISQMKELVVQNYNHPSIVVWGLSNEVTMMLDDELHKDMMENHEMLNAMVKEMDPTRKTVVAAVSMCSIHDDYLRIPDVVSYNLYYGWYEDDIDYNGVFLDNFHKAYPNTPIGLSEYGCEGLDWHGSELVRGDYTEEYQAYYHECLIRQLFTRKYIWATHVWNMFDFGCDARNEGGEPGQNHKGLVNIQRNYKKDSFYAYKAWLSDEPFVHLCGKKFIDRVDEVTKVTVYSNLPEVELFVNGKSFEKKTAEDHFFYFEVPNVGESHLKAVAGDCSDESDIRKVAEINPAYRFAESGPVLNWFDVTAPVGKYSINNKMTELMMSEEATKIVAPIWEKIEKKSGGEVPEFVKTLSLVRVIGYEKLLNDMNDKEEILAINRKLNEIDFV